MEAQSTLAGTGLAERTGVPVPRSPGRAKATPRPKPAPRPQPVLSAQHAHLGLEELRDYRTDLQTEEGKVSYWRRIIQARLDVVREGRTAGGTGPLDARRLRPVLSDARVGAGRKALVQVLPAADDIPPLPQLAELWERRIAPDDTAGLEALERDLAAAEAQLSEYRAVLHRRLADATGELIARYHSEPLLCLSALPLRRGGRPRA